MTSSNFRLIGSDVDCFKKLVHETRAIPAGNDIGRTSRHVFALL
jgi:hypothetical protein